jgi:hypothetical protein
MTAKFEAISRQARKVVDELVKFNMLRVKVDTQREKVKPAIVMTLEGGEGDT